MPCVLGIAEGRGAENHPKNPEAVCQLEFNI